MVGRSLLVLCMLLAGCASSGNDLGDEIGPPEQATESRFWDRWVRVFDVRLGDSYGLILVDPATLSDPAVAGLAARISNVTADSYVSVFVFTPVETSYQMAPVSASSTGEGWFSLSVPVSTTPVPVMFLFLFHAPDGGTLELTEMTESARDFERQFERDVTGGTWNLTGAAEMSVYSVSERGEYAYGVEVATSLVPNQSTGMQLQLSTSHSTSPGALELSTSLVGGVVSGGIERIEWTNGARSETRTFPVALSPAPVRPYPGHRLVDFAEGATGMRFEVEALAALGAMRFEHHSVDVDLSTLHVVVEEMFQDPTSSVASLM